MRLTRQFLMDLVVVHECDDGALDRFQRAVVIAGTLPKTDPSAIDAERRDNHGIAREPAYRRLTRPLRLPNPEVRPSAEFSGELPPAQVTFPGRNRQPHLMGPSEGGEEVLPTRLTGEWDVGGDPRDPVEPGEEVGGQGGVDKLMLHGRAARASSSAHVCFGNGALVCGVAYTEHGIIVGTLFIHAEF